MSPNKLIQVKGFVLRERFSGNSDKFIDILTEKYGIIEIYVKGARKITGKNLAPTMLFSYSDFCLSKRKNMYYIDSAEPICSFYGIASDIDAFALTSYITEVLSYSALSLQDSAETMRLVLNTMHFLSNKTRDISLLKAVFELRFMAENGYLPELTGCKECGTYETDEMYFIVKSGTLYCSDCYIHSENRIAVKLNRTVLHTVRYIMLSDFEKIFSFTLKDSSLETVCKLSELYLCHQIDRHFKTLDFYKSVRNIKKDR